MGSVKIGDLASKVESKQNGVSEINGNRHKNISANGKLNKRNGITHTSSQREFYDVLHQLGEGGFIELVVEGMFLSPSDTRNKVEQEIIREQFGGALKGTKQKEDLKTKVREGLAEIRSERERAFLKRAASDGLINGEAKRRKTANGEGMTDGASHALQSGSLKLDVGISSPWGVTLKC